VQKQKTAQSFDGIDGSFVNIHDDGNRSIDYRAYASLIVLRSHRPPIPRQQVILSGGDLVIMDAVEDVSEIGLWFEGRLAFAVFK